MIKYVHARKALFAISSLSVALISVWGCEKIEERDPCLQPRTVSLRMGLYRRAADTGTAVTDTFLPQPQLIPIDGAIAFGFGRTNKLALFLSPQADSCRYILRTDTVTGSDLDTLTFRYDRRTQFLSNACGYTYFFALRSADATTNRLDSVRINAFDVTSDVNVEHLRIYYAR